MPPIDFTAIPLDELKPSVSDPRPSLPLEPPEPDACSTFKGPGFVRLSEDGRVSFDVLGPPGLDSIPADDEARRIKMSHSFPREAPLAWDESFAGLRRVFEHKMLREKLLGTEGLARVLKMLPFPSSPSIERPSSARSWPSGPDNVIDPDGNGHFARAVFHIDASAMTDDGDGSVERPFRSFWPVRWWLALMDLLKADGWVFSRYHISILLRRGSEWTADGETFLGMALLSAHRASVKSSSDPPFSFLSREITDTMVLVDPLELAWRLFAADTDVVRSVSTVYSTEYVSLLGTPFFLCIPSGLCGISLDAYGSEFEEPRITGCLVYDESTEMDPYLDHGNEGLAKSIGLMSIPESAPCSPPFPRPLTTRPLEFPTNHDQMRVILFHGSSDVFVGNIDFSGFPIALSFWGVCTDVEVTNCSFETISSRGIIINLVKNHGYVEWVLPEDQAGRNAIAEFPMALGTCPTGFHFHDNFFYHVGQGSESAAIAPGTCATDIEVENNVFVLCVDGVTSDNGGSRIQIHHNAFILGLETCLAAGGRAGGDGNGIDIKGVRPRTALTETSAEELALVDDDRWTTIHHNWFLGNTGAAIVLHKGTSYVRLYNNYIIDNFLGIVVTPKVLSMLPVSEMGEVEGLRAVDYDGDLDADADDGALIGTISDWPSAVDRVETFTSVSDVTRTLFTTGHIYIYRNVIAANWTHGIMAQKGVTIMVCDQLDPDTEQRLSCGMNLENLVITQNTIDSNGGVINVYNRYLGTAAALAYHPQGHGISLSRDEVGDTDTDNYNCDNADSTELRDHFLGVAIYNNILSNNFYLQVSISDLSIDSDQFRNKDVSGNNVTPREDGSGIDSFVYHGLDYNAYYYPSDGDFVASRSCIYRLFDVDGAELDADGATTRLDSDVRIAVKNALTSASLQFGVGHWPYIWDSSDGGHPYLEMNRTFLDNYTESDVDARTFLHTRFTSLVQSFGFSRSVRDEHSGHGGLVLAVFYITEMFDGTLRDTWRTNDPSGEARDRGASSEDDYPLIAVTGDVSDAFGDAIDDVAVSDGAPDIGAHEV